MEPHPARPVNEVTTDRDLARAIAVACYGREPRVEAISRVNNLVFRLRFPGACKILKLARGPDAATIRKELALIGLLARHGIPVPAVEHADREGAAVGRPYVVMESAGDRTVADYIGHPGVLPPRLFTAMGAVLARIHGLTLEPADEGRIEGTGPRDPGASVGELHRLADRLADERLLGADEAALFKSLAFPSGDGSQLCHGDFHAVQCVVRDGRIAAVVDWESARAGNPAIDFAFTHAYLDFYSPPELVRCFMAGYTADRALPGDYDRAYLPVRMAHALALIRVWRGRQPVAGRPAAAGRRVERAVELFRAYHREWRA